MKLGTFGRAAFVLAGTVAAAAAVAQTAGGGTGINLPAEPQLIGKPDRSVVKATAIVNGEVITGGDIDHRLALILLAQGGGEIPPEELERVRAQILRNLIDETLQIQAAAARDIKIEQREIDNAYRQYVQRLGQTPQAFAQMLRQAGSSERSIKRQIHGEMAWGRLQRREIEQFVTVGEDEVRQIIERLEASKGTREYRVAEIFLSANVETQAETRNNAMQIVEQLRQGASFAAYARQFSEASTAAVGGDLGWVRPEQLPDEIAQAATRMQVGQLSEPIAIPGGFSIVALVDSRQILVADPRDAVLTLKQLSIGFPQGASRDQVNSRVQQLAQLGESMGGCGRAEQAAATIGAEVVTSDQLQIRDLPPQLQEVMLNLNIGQATQPFGTVEDGVRILVLCGRDDPDVSAPSFDRVYNQLAEERVNRRAQRFLRDLRRDAVIDYR